MQNLDIQLKTILMSFQSRTRMIYGKVEGLFYSVSSINSLKKESYLTEPSEIQEKLKEFINTNKAVLDNVDLSEVKNELTTRLTKIDAKTTGLLAFFRFIWNPKSLKQLFNHREILKQLLESVEEGLAIAKAPKKLVGGNAPKNPVGGNAPTGKITVPINGVNPNRFPGGQGNNPPPGTNSPNKRPLPSTPGDNGIPKPPPLPPPGIKPIKGVPVKITVPKEVNKGDLLEQIRKGKQLKKVDVIPIDPAIKNNPMYQAFKANAHKLRKQAAGDDDDDQKNIDEWEST